MRARVFVTMAPAHIRAERNVYPDDFPIAIIADSENNAPEMADELQRMIFSVRISELQAQKLHAELSAALGLIPAAHYVV